MKRFLRRRLLASALSIPARIVSNGDTATDEEEAAQEEEEEEEERRKPALCLSPSRDGARDVARVT